MKKILCISDSHGNIKAIEKLVPLMEKADYIFHLGDHYYDMKPFLERFDRKIYTVFGNCDGGGEDYVLDIEGVKILLTHGDKYHVKSSLLRLYLQAKSEDIRLVFFGHTHVPVIEENDGITLINPGNLTPFGTKTFCFCEIDDGLIKAEIENLESL